MCRKAELEVCLESGAWTVAFGVFMAWGGTSEWGLEWGFQCGLERGFQCGLELVAWIVWLGVWHRLCCLECCLERVAWSVWRGLWHGLCSLEGVVLIVAWSVWLGVFGSECLARSVWLEVCGLECVACNMHAAGSSLLSSCGGVPRTHK